MIDRARSRTRARGGHAFRVVKQLWGFAEVRYRGPARNLCRAHTMFVPANLYQLRRELLGRGEVRFVRPIMEPDPARTRPPATNSRPDSQSFR